MCCNSCKLWNDSSNLQISPLQELIRQRRETVWGQASRNWLVRCGNESIRIGTDYRIGSTAIVTLTIKRDQLFCYLCRSAAGPISWCRPSSAGRAAGGRLALYIVSSPTEATSVHPHLDMALQVSANRADLKCWGIMVYKNNSFFIQSVLLTLK